MTFPEDIFTEPEPDPDTLANLGPLRPLAGTWTSAAGADSHPVADGTEGDAFVEHYELNPIDAQTNGPQLFYGLRYHTHITKRGEIETFHDQAGYWLWEPATGNLLFTLAIPRGQVALAGGTAAPGDTRFRVSARAGDPHFGILTNPFLDYGFHTVSFTMTVTMEPDGGWSYEEDTVLMVRGRPEPFHHTDRNTLRRVADPVPNPLAQPTARAVTSSPRATRIVETSDGGNRPWETTPGVAQSAADSATGSPTSPQ